MVLDNAKTRCNRMRKRIASWVEVLNPVENLKFVLVTLTYAPIFEWEPNHVRTFMLSIKKVLGENLLAYAWVAELQKRGLYITISCWPFQVVWRLGRIYPIQIKRDYGIMVLHV